MMAATITACASGNTDENPANENTGDTNATQQAGESAHAGGENMPHEVAPMPEGEKSHWNIDTENSTVRWEGGTAGAQVYSHHGEIELKEGSFSTIQDQVVGGEFIIDMTTMQPKDDGYSEEHPASDLVAHLSSPDFFDVENHPTATFKVTRSEGLEVFGDLTIRGITKEGHMHIDMMEQRPDGLKVIGTLDFDRQKFDVAWKHYMQDVVLSDIIMLHFEVEATPAG